MKKIFSCVALAIIIFSSCKKHTDNCTHATVISESGGCQRWLVKIDKDSFPSGNIPAEFQVKNLEVCITYNLYNDPRECVCCGGTWADIKTIQ